MWSILCCQIFYFKNTEAIFNVFLYEALQPLQAMSVSYSGMHDIGG